MCMNFVAGLAGRLRGQGRVADLESAPAVAAEREGRWDKLKSLNCHFHCNKAVIFALNTTMVVALDAILVLTYTNVISHYFVILTLPAIVANYCYLIYLLDKAKSLRAARAAAGHASGVGGGQNPA